MRALWPVLAWVTSMASFASGPAWAQQAPSAGELLRDIEHLQVVGSVLYVAAHPDDENTRLIAWLVGDRGLRTGYLSLTRGGGGQNLIGSEQSELLGVVRTGELLAARGVDGGEQWFTRARDFGYSKSPEESLSFWGHDEVLDDVLRVYETFRPDVVITRFPTDGQSHGHHIASARLAGEAFEKADPGFKPDRLLRNQSSWRIDENTDTSSWLQLDVGTYDPRIGRSYGEISATSRTMHKSQGFGSSPSVGEQVEYFESLAGTALGPADDVFAGLDLSWSRFEGTKPLQKTLAKAAASFDPRQPHLVLPILAKAHEQMQAVPDDHWRAIKLAELEQVMRDCAGLWLEARSEQPAVRPGATLPLTLRALPRSGVVVELRGVDLPGQPVPGGPILPGTEWTAELELPVAEDTLPTRPHWLVSPPSTALYTIPEGVDRVLADTPASLIATFHLTLAGVEMDVPVPVEHVWTDRVHGERRHPVEVLPEVTASFAQKGVLLPAGSKARTTLTVAAPAGPAKGTLAFTAPDGITVTPGRIDYDLTEGTREQVVELTIAAVADAEPGQIRVDAFQRAVIDHPHLPRRTVLAPGVLEVTPVGLDRGGIDRIAYVQGSGDAVPDALRSVGYTVEELDAAALGNADLSAYDAVVLGIRAYNTHPELMTLNDRLMDYVAGGGRMLVQYNTNSRWTTLDGPIGPAPFRISRDRITDETAELIPNDPMHPVMHSPNSLDDPDFEGWVQERGLYFADEWDPIYTPVFGGRDPGEEAVLQGGVLVAKHGEGAFVYTGLSFFRQLPAGVPGATRLLANLLAFDLADPPETGE